MESLNRKCRTTRSSQRPIKPQHSSARRKLTRRSSVRLTLSSFIAALISHVRKGLCDLDSLLLGRNPTESQRPDLLEQPRDSKGQAGGIRWSDCRRQFVAHRDLKAWTYGIIGKAVEIDDKFVKASPCLVLVGGRGCVMNYRQRSLETGSIITHLSPRLHV